MTTTLLLCWFIGFSIIDSVKIDTDVPGVAFGDGHVWVTRNGANKVYKIDPDSLVVVDSFSHTWYLTGLAHDGDHLWVAGYPDSIHKYDTLGNLENVWQSPGPYSYGLAFDGQYIWHGDYTLSKIYVLDHQDPSVILDSFDMSGSICDLAWYNNRLWVMAEWAYIYEIDPSNMDTVNMYPTGRPWSAGLAIGGGYLWFSTVGGSGTLYKVDSFVGASEGEPRNISALQSINLSPNPFSGKLTIQFAARSLESAGGQREPTLHIYDATGRTVKNFPQLTANGLPSAAIVWDGTDDQGNTVSAGIYFIRFTSAFHKESKKVIYTK